MYSKSVTAKNVATLSKKLGFQLEYHDTRTIKNQIRRFNEIVGDDGRMIRALHDDEIQWILNERVLSQLDFRYFVSRYAFVSNYTGGQIVRFEPNIAQNIVLDIWVTLEEQGKAISIQQLKARQLGVSTLTELAVAHRVQFYSYTNAVVASSDPDKSAKMAKMMERCWENQPWWLMPKQTKYVSGELIEFGEIFTGVSIQHGTQFTGIARGDTPNVAHLSELSDFIDPEQLVDASLIQAMHESPSMFLVLESTAAGRRNWWHKTWAFSKENWSRGMARLFPMFLPWFVGRDIYPTETWLQTRPIPYQWEPSQLTLHHAERCKAYVKSDTVLQKYLGEHWVLPVEQMWYWEVTRKEFAAKKELSDFYSEMPADDMEAFQSTNISIFDPDTLSHYHTHCKDPIGVYGFIGRAGEIPIRMQPDRRDVDPERSPITIRANWNPSIEPFECQMVPLKFRGYPNFSEAGKFLMYEFPEENETYGCGVDTGDGIGEDNSVIEVLRKGSIDRNDAQVGEFASPYISAKDLWPICMALGSLYSTPVDRVTQQAKMVIECWGNGDIAQLELRKRGWSHFHHWMRYDNKRLRQASSNKLGWYTNRWSRAMLMDEIVKAIRDEWLDVNSPYFVEEMADLERDEAKQSFKAAYGAHDDRIMALGFVFFSLHILEIRGSSRSIASHRMALKNSMTVDPVYSSGWQAQDGAPGFSSVADLEERVSMREDF